VQTYKTQLRRRLAEHGWEVVEVSKSDEWWVDEFWKVQSRRNLWGYEIVLTFLVDPLWEGGNKSQGVWAIAANDQMPADRVAAESGFRLLSMSRGRFDEQLAAFITTINDHRNAQEATPQGQE
jgi:hypothetical protein